jgi:MoaA/NifB/PqqE/SkfB family radical SAM enzyme
MVLTYYLHLTNKCNLNCVFCADSDEKKSHPDSSFSEIKELLYEKRKQYDNIFITGGEPTISPLFIKTIKYSRQIGYKDIYVATNGLMFSKKDFLRKTIIAGLTSIQLSYISNDSAMYDLLVNKSGANEYFKKALNNIKDEIFFTVNIVLHNLNKDKIFDFIKDLIRNKCSQINISLIHPFPSCKYYALSYTDALPYIKKMIKRYDNRLISIENIPLCIEPKLVDYVRITPKDKYHIRIREKIEQCNLCKKNNHCLGPHKEYIHVFGFKELRPII